MSEARRAGWKPLMVGLAVVVASCAAPPPEAGTSVATGNAPSGLVVVDESLIVVHGIDRTVVRVESDGTTTVLARGPVGPASPLAAFGSLWMILPAPAGGATPPLGALVRLDPTTGDEQARFDAHGSAIAATDTHVFVMGDMGDQPGWLWRVDPATNEVATYPDLMPTLVVQLLFDGESLWAVANCLVLPCTPEQPRLASIDPATGMLTGRGDLPPDLVVSDADLIDGTIWIAGIVDLFLPEQSGALLSVDRQGQVTATYEVGRFPAGMAEGGDGIWLSDCLTGTVTELDPTTGDVITGPIEVGTAYPADEAWDPFREDYSCPGALAVAGDTLWVANSNDDAVVPVR